MTYPRNCTPFAQIIDGKVILDVEEFIRLCDNDPVLAHERINLVVDGEREAVPTAVLAYLDTHHWTDSTIDDVADAIGDDGYDEEYDEELVTYADENADPFDVDNDVRADR